MQAVVYQSQNYKETLKIRLKLLQAKRKGLTLKKIASLLPVQYTYLSKSFNDDKTHLNEDHLYKFCSILEFGNDETDFILNQRSYELTSDERRKQYLYTKLEETRSRNLRNLKEKPEEPSDLKRQMQYLFNPQCIIIHVALFIEQYRKNPYLLCDKLNLELKQLRELLAILANNDFIELGEDAFEIRNVKDSHFHFGKDHPLMRVHQNILKTSINSKLLQIPEEKKVSQLVTFTSDEKGREEIINEFELFLKRVETICINSKQQYVYQLSFDLFHWI